VTDIADEDIREALDRIARTADGRLLYRYLQKILCDVTPPEIPDGALPRQEGKRSFARNLMELMAEGIDAGADESGRAVVFRQRERVAKQQRVSPREWLAANPDQWPGQTGPAAGPATGGDSS